MVEQIAVLYGLSKEDAAALVIKRGLEDRVRKNTGKRAAKVYPIGRRK